MEAMANPSLTLSCTESNLLKIIGLILYKKVHVLLVTLLPTIQTLIITDIPPYIALVCPYYIISLNELSYL